MKAMKANEIRIGNYYQDRYGNYHIVEELSKSLFVDDHFDRGVSTKQMLPITLTEETLLKAGGKRFDEDKIILMLNDPSTHLVLMKVGTHWFPQIEQTGEFASEGVNVVFLNFIDYIHQLQNLFFALTGGEIKIEL